MPINNLLKRSFLAFVLLLGVQFVNAQSKGKSAKEAETKQLIESKKFVFKATSALPMGGGMWQLTSDYNVQVSGDTVIADLPYFGRAFSVTMMPGDAGFNFTTTDFAYKAEPNKNGWQITIEPQDGQNARQLILNVSKGGNATLQVFSNNRQPITFNGYIAKRK